MAPPAQAYCPARLHALLVLPPRPPPCRRAGLLPNSCLARLQHAADGVLALEPLGDDSALFALLPDPARWGRGGRGREETSGRRRRGERDKGE